MKTENNNDEVFTIKARRCKRCGGLLTSTFGVREGYGHVCKKKAKEDEEKNKLPENQMTFFDN